MDYDQRHYACVTAVGLRESGRATARCTRALVVLVIPRRRRRRPFIDFSVSAACVLFRSVVVVDKESEFFFFILHPSTARCLDVRPGPPPPNGRSVDKIFRGGGRHSFHVGAGRTPPPLSSPNQCLVRPCARGDDDDDDDSDTATSDDGFRTENYIRGSGTVASGREKAQTRTPHHTSYAGTHGGGVNKPKRMTTGRRRNGEEIDSAGAAVNNIDAAAPSRNRQQQTGSRRRRRRPPPPREMARSSERPIFQTGG